MSRYDYYGGWAPYVPVAERRRKAEQEVKKLRRQGKSIAPVTIEGRQIATTFWGKAWCKNLENYLDYETRLPRGRACVRHSLILDLQITEGRITALVSGSEMYDVAITITKIPEAEWGAICADCSSGIDSLVELLQGRFSKGIMERICRQENGLFPKPTEIKFSCTCPDHASMCKHVAGALYGVGARLDHQPELLFQLRGVNADDLIAEVDTSTPFSTTDVDADKVLAENDLSALFGLNISEEPVTSPERPHSKTKSKSPTPRKASSANKPKRPKARDSVKAESDLEDTPSKEKKPGKVRGARAKVRLNNTSSASGKTRT